MATARDRADNRNADKLQGVGLPRVSGPEEKPLPNESPLWTVNVRPFLIHNAHVSDGQRFHEKCQLCRRGLEGVITSVETEVPFDQVDARRRSDEEKAAALALDSERDEPAKDGPLW